MEMIILAIHLVIVIAMVLVILVQRSNTDGLSGLSGGGNASGNSLFSVRGKANILTKATSYLAFGFIITSLTLAYMANHSGKGSIADKLADEKSVSAPASVDANGKAAEPATPTEPEVPVAE